MEEELEAHKRSDRQYLEKVGCSVLFWHDMYWQLHFHWEELEAHQRSDRKHLAKVRVLYHLAMVLHVLPVVDKQYLEKVRALDIVVAS
jgi:hypothetical protein